MIINKQRYSFFEFIDENPKKLNRPPHRIHALPYILYPMYTKLMFLRHTNSILWAGLWTGLLIVLFSGKPGWTRDRDIDSHGKLALLNRATGKSSTTNPASFSNRVSNILDRNATANRTVIANEDAEIRAAQFQALPEEELFVTGYSISQTEADWRKAQDAAKNEEEDDGKGILDSKLNRAERSYLEERDEIFRQEDLRRETILKEKQIARKPASETQQRSIMDGNPFYFGQLKEETNSYIENRHIIVSRLAHGGYDYDRAIELVHSLTSIEDLIIHLIQVDGYTYGEATEITAGL